MTAVGVGRVLRPAALGVLAAGALATAPGSLRSQQRGATIPVQAAVGIEPDTVRIGDPFLVQVGIRAPTGATIEFPAGPDSTSAVQPLDRARIDPPRSDSAGAIQWAHYRLAAWNLGDQPVNLGDVVISLGDQVRRIPLHSRVFVASVLPADSAQRVPKPARPIYEFAAPVWWLWALATAALLMLLLLWWWWRRRKRAAPVAVVDPFARAEREFARVEALRLIEAGERGRYVTLMLEVLRDYLAARYPLAPLSHTSTELVTALREQRGLPRDRLARLLTEADLIKFARRPVTADRARELGRDARSIVAQDHAASLPSAPPVERAA
jgi:hypothetical protein